MRSSRGGGTQRIEGASAVEFALVLPILVLFVFGIIEFGIAYNRVQSFQAAAREAGRLASVGVDVESGPANERVRGIAGSTVDAEQVVVAVDVECPSGQSSGPDPEYVRVEVRLADPSAYPIRIPLVPLDDPDYRAEAVFRCETPP